MHSSTSTLASLALLITGALSNPPNSYHFNPLEHLAGVTPPFDPLDPPLDPAPPRGCNVTRAAILSRHSSIKANEFDWENFIHPFVQKLSQNPVDWSKIPTLSFLATWKPPRGLHEKGALSLDGKSEATRLGVDVSQRYQKLRVPPKIWTAGATRVVESAHSFAMGMADNPRDIKVVELYEGKQDAANSLTPYKGCPRYKAGAGNERASVRSPPHAAAAGRLTDSIQVFRKLYTAAPIARFSKVAPAFNFTPADIYGMSLLCGYETVLRGSSPFCDLELLTPDEWLGFEYNNDISYYYSTGYGSPVAGAVGFPYVQATFNRLMAKQDKNSNATADQDLFVSFTHRQMPPTVFVAMGLYNNSAFSGTNDIHSSMPLDRINHRRAWKSSHIIPFLTNLAIERMECDCFAYQPGTYYRALVNNSPQPMDGCSSGPGESCPENELPGWLAGRAKVVGSYGAMCATNYPNSTDTLSIFDQ
ncbi:hypothetical protein JHW43_003532 [Diplocarpon mali]|nr:hypothetical protein JHW43_003532 [Diplocarpon mali]